MPGTIPFVLRDRRWWQLPLCGTLGPCPKEIDALIPSTEPKLHSDEGAWMQRARHSGKTFVLGATTLERNLEPKWRPGRVRESPGGGSHQLEKRRPRPESERKKVRTFSVGNCECSEQFARKSVSIGFAESEF